MALPTAFVDQVKDALDHLYDLSYLSEHALTADLRSPRLPAGVSRAHALRQTILDAIHGLQEELPPGLANRPGRIYHLPELRYIESLPYREVMSELGLSQPQYHREQRRAVEALATLLWEQTRQGESHTDRPLSPERTGPWNDDLQAVAPGPEMAVDLTELVGGVVSLLERMARGNEVVFQGEITGSPLSVAGNRTVLRQLLIAAASYVLRGVRGGRLTVRCLVQDTRLRFDVAFQGTLAADRRPAGFARERWAEGERLLSVVDGSWTLDEDAADGVTLSILLTRPCHQLLVIDDNPDMVQMISRFVSGQGYTVFGALSVDEGIALAKRQRPNVIVLDVMMPGRDGWDALQALKNHPATDTVPVLVCTILGESELALALGAQGFLRKPITRPRLLASLRRCTR